ncbi:FecR family protein [Rubrivirga sp.]|uniref:FecR family protein n=1 Tax=Rubrivirga sp. TaxID=1885344 RepID=UPI003B51E003
MPPLPSDDRDRDLARRLDRGEPADERDPLDAALRAVRSEPPAVGEEVSERLWGRIEAEIGPPPTARTRPERVAPDRPALRLARVARWAVAAGVLLAVGTWWMTSRPDVVAVAAMSAETYRAADGTAVTLRPHSRLVRLDERAYRVEGEAFFAVTAGGPFTVEAGAGTVRVLGTRFDVSTWGGRTAVYVDEGRVAVEAGGEAVTLGAGQAATASPSGVARTQASAESALDWRRGEAVFVRESVRRVADEIGQHFGVAVTLPTDVAGQSVSGALALDSAEQALADLGRILGGRFEPTDGGFRFVRG